MSESMENIFQLGEVLEQRLVQLEDSLEDQINKVLDISRIGSAFTSYLNLDIILPTVIETALSLVKGEVGEVLIFDYEGKPKSVSWGLNIQIVNQIKAESGKSIIDEVKETGEVVALNNLDYQINGIVENLAININSIIVAPLKSQDEVLGVIAIANKEDDEEFDSDDNLSLDLIGSFAAVAVKNAVLHHEALASQKLENELQIAEHVQSTLMPSNLVENESLKIHTYYDMAGQVGGDFYDIIGMGDEKYLIVVGDVSNKGIPAALIMTSVRSYVRVLAGSMESLADMVSKVNEHLSRDMTNVGGMFVTMFFSLIDMKEHTLQTVNAGHPPSYLFKKDGFESLKTGGPFVGQFPELEYTESIVKISKGDRLIVYTDGIFECVNSEGEMLGLAGSLEFFKQNKDDDWPEFSKKLKDLLIEYSFDQGRVDDTTLLLIEVKK